MTKWLFVLLFAVLSIPVFADGKSGVGFEFGTNFLMASNDYSGTGTFFTLDSSYQMILPSAISGERAT